MLGRKALHHGPRALPTHSILERPRCDADAGVVVEGDEPSTTMLLSLPEAFSVKRFENARTHDVSHQSQLLDLSSLLAGILRAAFQIFRSELQSQSRACRQPGSTVARSRSRRMKLEAPMLVTRALRVGKHGQWTTHCCWPCAQPCCSAPGNAVQARLRPEVLQISQLFRY